MLTSEEPAIDDKKATREIWYKLSMLLKKPYIALLGIPKRKHPRRFQTAIRRPLIRDIRRTLKNKARRAAW